ncbi:MAG: creatininase family protein [Leucobacter sp.]
MENRVRWSELLPREFVARRDSAPIVWLPMGICEPHGHVAAFGLDTVKADYLCDESARRIGGIVAPTQGYHVHETGPHAPWLREVVGDVNPLLASYPPDLVLRTLVFQLRAFRNAGFRLAVVVTGHHGNQDDLRLAAEEFMRRSPMRVIVRSDPELAASEFEGDHAGSYEVSQLMYLRPDLVDLGRIDDGATSELKRFAQGFDASAASAERGRAIIELSLDKLGALVASAGSEVGVEAGAPVGASASREVGASAGVEAGASAGREVGASVGREAAARAGLPAAPLDGFMSLDEADEVWNAVASRRDEWVTLREG